MDEMRNLPYIERMRHEIDAHEENGTELSMLAIIAKILLEILWQLMEAGDK